MDLLTRGIIENGKTIPPYYSIHDQNHLMVVTQKTYEFCSEICHIVDQMKILLHLADCNCYTEAKRCFATHDEDIILICVYILF